MRRILPAFAAVIACTACTVPIFDPSASLAARTLDSIPVYRVTGPLDVPLNEDEEPRFDLLEDAFTFLPERYGGTLGMGSGFVIRTRDRIYNEVHYVWNDGATQWIGGDWGHSSDDPMLPRWVMSLKDGPYLGAVSLDSSEGEAIVFHANTSSRMIEWYLSTNLANALIMPGLGLVSTPQVVGVSVNAAMDSTYDEFRVLVREGSSFSEGVANVNSSGFVSTFSPVYSSPAKEYALPFLGTPRQLRYFHEGVYKRSFAQSYDPGTGAWTTWAWWDTVSGNRQLAPITHRIDAVLSNVISPAASHLFSTEDQVGRVYRFDGTGDGELVAEFALGTLRFIGEMYCSDDGVWRMLFSRCVPDPQNKRISFEIRAIATADLVATFPLTP